MTIIKEALIVLKVSQMKFRFLISALFLIILIIISGCTQQDRADQLYTEGLNYNDHSNFERALDCFNKSLEINPDSAEVWVARGVTLFNMKRYNESKESIEKALELNPEVPFGQTLKMEILNALEKT
jgi:tetratricopeptide (TPR) repeat protein